VDFIRLGLQYEGFEVSSAADGRAALAAISELKPGAVMTIRLPALQSPAP